MLNVTQSVTMKPVDAVSCFVFSSPEKSLLPISDQSPQGEGKSELPDEKKKAQSTVDDQILKAVAKNADLAKYLAATFTLRDADLPHAMKF